MASEAEHLLESGRRALDVGDWPAAHQAFAAAVALDESGEALFGLGAAMWWTGELDLALRTWERAHVAYRRRGDPAGALLSAVYLFLATRMSLGAHVVANGWLTSAEELLAEHDLHALEGWVLLCRAYRANDADRTNDAARWARAAIDSARSAGDADLELCASCELGSALVGGGQLDAGAALLDRAMVGALAGEASALDTVVLVSCRTITTCSRAADLHRAARWIEAAGEFNRRVGSSHLYRTCRIHYGRIRFATGDWPAAERELTAALSSGLAAEPALRADALAGLARLRLAQGRTEEAVELLRGTEDWSVTTPERATLLISTGSPAAAAALVRRRLREVDERPVERAELVDLLAEAEVASGIDTDSLIRQLRLLTDVVSEQACDVVVAHGRRALGRALTAAGDTDATGELEMALSAFTSAGMPYESARTRLLISSSAKDDEPEAAVADAQLALACFQQLGAARDADVAAALLRSLGVRPVRTAARDAAPLTRREREILALLGEGLSNRDIAERTFISRKTVEHHVASVLAKLGLSRRAEATVYALRQREAESARK